MMLTRKLRILTTSMLEKEEIIGNLKNLGQGSISLQNGSVDILKKFLKLERISPLSPISSARS
nr:unnamed protein product [Callosobruchus chinensis]